MTDMDPLIKNIDQPGLKAPDHVAHALRTEVARLLNRDKLDFPGAQPVSFTRAHFEELRNQDYFVCEKSDGIRYLMYCTVDENEEEVCYFIDRRNDYWWVKVGSLHFPRPESAQSFHTKTLLDGELVIDEMPDGRKEPRYLVFDCLVMDGQNLMTRDLSKRLGYFQEQMKKPYDALLREYPQEKRHQPFFLGMKDMQMAYGIEMMFREVIINLRHENDGLIFTCRWSHYKHGTDPNILKWKKAEENTVDFQWKLHFPTVGPEFFDDGSDEPGLDFDSVPQVQLLAFHGGSGRNAYKPYGSLHLTEAEWEELKKLNDPLDSRIVEAYMDSQGRWRFFRFRDDKQHGNHVSVIEKVLDSIRDPVTEEELMAASKGIRDNWKQRETERKAERLKRDK